MKPPKLDARQKIALAHPCWRAADTMHQRFIAVAPDRELEYVSSVLTVNR